MANKCFVTQYEKNSNNENLPPYGSFVINFEKTPDATANQRYIIIGGGNKPCHVKLNNLSISSGEFSGLTEFDITAGVTKAFNVDSLNNNDMSIEISCYEISALGIVAPTKSIIGFDSIQHSSRPVRLQTDSVPIITAKALGYTNIQALFNYFGGTLEEKEEFAIRNKSTLAVYLGLINPEAIAGNTVIQRCNLIGDVVNYPATIKSIYVSSNGATGSITALVEKFRAAGRTSGKIEASWLGVSDLVTIDDGNGNEVGARTYITNKGINPAIEKMYLSWTADSIDITKDDTGAERYMSIFGNPA